MSRITSCSKYIIVTVPLLPVPAAPGVSCLSLGHILLIGYGPWASVTSIDPPAVPFSPGKLTVVPRTPTSPSFPPCAVSTTSPLFLCADRTRFWSDSYDSYTRFCACFLRFVFRPGSSKSVKAISRYLHFFEGVVFGSISEYLGNIIPTIARTC